MRIDGELMCKVYDTYIGNATATTTGYNDGTDYRRNRIIIFYT